AMLIAGIVCLVLWLPASSPPAPGVTIANVERIHAAMKREDVQQLMGRKGRDWGENWEWHGKECNIWVGFEDGFARDYGIEKGRPFFYGIIKLEQNWRITLLRWWRRYVG